MLEIGRQCVGFRNGCGFIGQRGALDRRAVRMNLTFDDIYLEDAVVVAGQLEGSGPLKAYFDSVDECKDCCFENSEIGLFKQHIHGFG